MNPSVNPSMKMSVMRSAITFALLCCIAPFASGATAVPGGAPAAVTATVPGGVAQKARTVRTTDLRDAPSSDGKLLEVVQGNTELLVQERRGGWYRVRYGERNAWVRLTAVRFATATPSSGGGITAPLAFLHSGRSAVQTGTVTTGVRGLSEVDLQNSTPNNAAVDALDALAVGSDDARDHATRLGLAPVNVDFVKVPKKDKDHKGKDDDEEGGG